MLLAVASLASCHATYHNNSLASDGIAWGPPPCYQAGIAMKERKIAAGDPIAIEVFFRNVCDKESKNFIPDYRFAEWYWRFTFTRKETLKTYTPYYTPFIKATIILPEGIMLPRGERISKEVVIDDAWSWSDSDGNSHTRLPAGTYTVRALCDQQWLTGTQKIVVMVDE